MIIEIPNAEDYQQSSLNQLNLAWQIAMECLRAYEHSEVIHAADTPVREVTMPDGRVMTFGGPDTTYTPEERVKAEELYWRRSQPALGNALSLIQQAIEMSIKGRIAGVSPFLLIARDPSEYPKNGTKGNVPFSAFRSIDAADLFKVHNTVCPTRLTEAFGSFWDAIRRQRNVLMHSVVPSVDLLRPAGLIEQILVVCQTLYPDKSWFRRRLDYLSNDEMEAAYSPQPQRVYGSVLEDLDLVFHHLTPKALREHFGFDTRSRAYLCMLCKAECDDDLWEEWSLGRYAQLLPRGPASSTLRCAACGRTSAAYRERCDEDCSSNVLVADEDGELQCATCGAAQYDQGEDGELTAKTATSLLSS